MVATARLNQRYRLVRPLGRGADADVYLALDGARDDAPRALKIVRGVADARARERLAGEFRRLAALAHPRLVRVHDLEVAMADGFLPRGTLFFTADYVEGRPPTEAVSAAPEARRVERLLGIAEDVAAALAHVHASGLVHHDVKPANLLVDTAGRATLLDLGLSTARAVAGVARGTPAYMAPEAFAGVDDPRLDLYALGVTLHEVATGRPPFVGATPTQLVRAILEEPLAPPRLHAPWLPEPVERLLVKLLAREPEARHSSAAILLQDLGRVREACGLGGSLALELEAGRPGEDAEAPPTLLPPPLVGRDDALRALDEALRALAEGAEAPRVVLVAGGPGAGKTRLIEEAIRRHQLRVAAGRAAPLEVVGDTWPRLLAALGLDAAPAPADVDDAGREHARLAERVAAAISRRAADRLLVHLADAGDDERSAALVRLALAEEHPAWTVVAEVGEELETTAADAALAVALPPLRPAEVEEVAARVLGREVAGGWARALARATGGVPRLVVEAVRAAAARAGIDRADAVPLDEILGTRGLVDVVERRLDELAPPARALADALAVHGDEAPLDALAAIAGVAPEAVYAEAAALAARGLVRPLGDRVAFPSPAHARAVYGAIPASRRTALHRAALRHAEAAGASARVRARHLAVVGRGRGAARTCLLAAAEARAEGDLAGAFAHLGDAARLGDGPEAAEALLEQAALGVVLGRYDEALAAARRASAGRERRRRAERLIARALTRRGDLEGAEQLLGRLLKADPDDEEARGALARLLVTRGRYRQALEIAGRPESEPVPVPIGAGRAARLEAAGLAALYSGDLDRAQAAFARLEAAARDAGDQGLLGRALSLQGLVAHGRGDMATAAERYAEALACARAAGDVHAAALCALNRATALAERAEWGEVLALTAEGFRDLRRLGRVGELAGVMHNRGIALLALGDVEAARRAAEQALAEARARGLPHLEAYAEMLVGDVARREGSPERALAGYERAAAVAAARGSSRELALAAMSRAETLAELGRGAEAERALADAAAAAAGDDERDRLAVAAARVALATGAAPGPALDRLVPTCRRLRESGRLDLAWRAEVQAARLAFRAGDATQADELLARARGTWTSIAARAPEARRDGLEADPDARAMAAIEVELAGRSTMPRAPLGAASAAAAAAALAARAAASPDGGAAEPEATRLRRLLNLSKRLNSELRLEPLLDEIIDTVIDLTCAERGFLLLRDGDGDGRLQIRVARNIDQRAIEGEELAVSRSIAERAAATGEPVLTIDAVFDERFGEATSVSAFKLRSVLAVPLRLKGRVVGTIYVDHRFRRGAFDEAQVVQVIDLADLAAIALWNAQLAEENERRRAEVAELAERLEAELERNRAELDGARAALRASGALDLRYAYDALIGRSPRMLELLRLVDRATETSLPVVIYGESGTGKELVARALHQNGPRRDRPFVPVNCAAVPETLLEAELFGHARGAFTGADRDRRGLFEVADGGTLFLDEIADTSPAMQTRLLRVLQEGEIRRVGGERPRQVDVRVIAASNRDLRRLVEEGRFREDLFYRLHVIRLEVPALRERAEDIPALVEHFLRKLAGQGGAPRRVDRAAMARLVAYPWPGNVRELENELLRAAALGGEVIGLEDLSPAIAAADPTMPPVSPDDLGMKPRVEKLERALLREALARANGNQTQAAKLLGLSRFGLQKKLKRYGL